MYVPVTVTYAGRTWTQVGMRYKGNSSLMGVNTETGGKIPFRLDFDRYEDQDPAIRNQRFYGFQKLTFASNVGDDTQLHEALAVEVFRDRGVPAARAAFYRVYVDTGSGAEYWGLYTMIEDPADGAMLDAQLGGSGGNLYKPEGFAANWSLPFDAESFGKKNNEKAADFSDVQGAVTALHASRDDARMWRAALEARFDVDLFLQWLAVNTVIQNWDAYGGMPHNYYLYSPPKRKGQLRWIPWDHNFAFGAGPMGGGGRGFGPPAASDLVHAASDPVHAAVVPTYRSCHRAAAGSPGSAGLAAAMSSISRSATTGRSFSDSSAMTCTPRVIARHWNVHWTACWHPRRSNVARGHCTRSSPARCWPSGRPTQRSVPQTPSRRRSTDLSA